MSAALTPPTPENVAGILAADDNGFHDGNGWYARISATGNVVSIEVEPLDEDGDSVDKVHFRAVVVEGDETPIVLPQPTELGVVWEDGEDLPTLTPEGISFNLRGIDEWDMDADGARELAAHLAAMADAYEAAQGESKTAGGAK